MQWLWAMRNSHGASGRLSSIGVEAAVGAKQRVLHDVFAVSDRAGHPGAVSVQLRPELADRFEKCQVPRVELSCVFHHVSLLAEQRCFLRQVGLPFSCRDQAAQTVVDVEAPCALNSRRSIRRQEPGRRA